MAKFQPGQSGNPNGRPKKERALTAILERAGGKTIEVDGKKVAGRQLIARMVWEGVTTGRVSFPDGASLKLSPTDWKDFVKWIYTQVDGPPKAEVDITTNGEQIGAMSPEQIAERVTQLLAIAEDRKNKQKDD